MGSNRRNRDRSAGRRPAVEMEKRETLRVEERPNDVLLATLDRPEVANAFDSKTALELCELFERFQSDQRYRCVVITGAGDKAFCSGADLKERKSLSDEQWRSQHETFER